MIARVVRKRNDVTVRIFENENDDADMIAYPSITNKRPMIKIGNGTGMKVGEGGNGWLIKGGNDLGGLRTIGKEDGRSSKIHSIMIEFFFCLLLPSNIFRGSFAALKERFVITKHASRSPPIGACLRNRRIGRGGWGCHFKNQSGSSQSVAEVCVCVRGEGEGEGGADKEGTRDHI